ncbi:MAG: DUF4339 domain-containing protein [Muribaculaceae bacterium]|nr:DUF4339 domain-containing protein [Muribaculaceae bacterium]
MQYWIIIDNERRGPMRLEELTTVAGFGPDTPVWREGLPDWTTAGQLPETAALVGFPEPVQPYVAPQAPQPVSYAAPRQPLRPGDEERPPMPPTYLVWAILATICCCIVTGVVAIIYSSKVSPLYYRGDYAGAKKASEMAGWWVIISFVAGLIWTPFYTLYTLLTA